MRASEKCLTMPFKDVDIRHRMANVTLRNLDLNCQDQLRNLDLNCQGQRFQT